MADTDLIVAVQPGDGDDLRERQRLTEQLRAALLDLDIDAADRVSGGTAPAGSKGAGLIESLVVKLGVVAVTTAVVKIREWAGRSNRSVKISIDGDSIELTCVTAAQQQELLDIWLARHAAPRS
ncbi:hypothetical protein [Paractinoplanes rishiriensis]|uniref:Uncharacterized protein n=1 Tax=Paractinoplanes rishiriensis TaxID=1050105 RepID=A0A919MUP9_9ACTN|nr:hypothetical protein [Actinoplanes rishiriensis]GIE92810.1 hypothetical protein Ari01nite_02750 [Actinoplanes rishiriensis]